MADPAEEARSLPLDERLVHANWKVRLEAYEDLEKKYNACLDGFDPIFSNTGAPPRPVACNQRMFSAPPRPLPDHLAPGSSSAFHSVRLLIIYYVAPLLKGIIDDKNVVAKEKGLAAVLIYVDRCDDVKRSSPIALSFFFVLFSPVLNFSSRTALSFAPSLVECLAGREKTKALATDVLLLAMEIDVLEPYIVRLSLPFESSRLPKSRPDLADSSWK